MHKLALEIDDTVYQKLLDFIKQLPVKSVKLINIDDTIMTKEDFASYNLAVEEFKSGDTYSIEQAKRELLGDL